MRGTVAKRIRKEVYGDFSTRDKSYKEKWYRKVLKAVSGLEGKSVDQCTVSNTGLRSEYKAAKKTYISG